MKEMIPQRYNSNLSVLTAENFSANAKDVHFPIAEDEMYQIHSRFRKQPGTISFFTAHGALDVSG